MASGRVYQRFHHASVCAESYNGTIRSLSVGAINLFAPSRHLNQFIMHCSLLLAANVHAGGSQQRLWRLLRRYDVLIQQLGDASPSVGYTILELHAAAVGCCG